MDKELSVLIIEDEPDERDRLIECIEANPYLAVGAATNNSNDGLKYVKELLPEIIILDLELHKGGGNGIVFLHELNKMALNVSPYIIVTTNNTSGVTNDHVRSVGADFIYSKHQTDYSAETVVTILASLKDSITNKFYGNLSSSSTPESEDQLKKSMIKRIQTELNLIGINAKSLGFKYLIDAILLVIEGFEPNYCNEIGKKYTKSGASVERAIQNAINRAWKNNDIEVLIKHYKAFLSEKRGVPTQMEFVHYYANMIKTDFL